MPTYEYKCDACGHAFEQFQSIKADPIKKCPKCGKNKVKRLISAGAGLIFKGSGFYITDYRSQSYKDSAKSESGSAEKKSDAPKSDAPAKSDTPAKTESPAPKAESKPAESKPPSKPKPSK